ncbi:hypothetical protein RMB03_17540 [Acinetobacter sp. V91_7]|uniref:hypothetical protein n=1 Tax=unclassified Acinetobacter TaxID=196816 RepID=UPI00287DF527|nr:MULTISPECIES: hypothetical protein [unclassified Acinetobacter]MDS7935639.1 hypothetical protein [Acinetobacter sp. V91_4B]MDS7964753.1 hypothetical protein [Acinetobacter sp. V91_7]MDS8025552.1 hypothetical protein [Acinetobacter sp. V91_13]
MDQKTLDFLEDLHEITNKHGVYISTLLDGSGNIKSTLHLIPIESGIQSAGYYVLNSESNEIVFDWC